MSDAAASILMGIIFATALAYVTYMYGDFPLGWRGFFGTWAGLTVAQWIFRPLMWLLITVFGIGLLVGAVYGVGLFAVAIMEVISLAG